MIWNVPHVILTCTLFSNHVWLSNCDLSVNHPKNAIAEALLQEATTEIILKTDLTSSLVIAVGIETNIESYSFVNDVIARLHQRNVVTITSIVKFGVYDARVNISFAVSNLLIVDSTIGYLSMIKHVDRESLKPNSIFMVLIYGYDPNELLIQQIFDRSWRAYLLKVLVITQSMFEDAVHIYTYSPFTAGNCRNPVKILWNTFYKGMGFLYKDRLFLNPLQNMSRCPLMYAAYQSPPFVYFHKRNETSYEIFGIEGKLLKTLKELMNFSIQVKEIPDNERDGVVYENGTGGTGAVGMLIRHEANFSIGSSPVIGQKLKFLTVSEPSFTDNLVFTLPTERDLVGLEKMFLVFDLMLWISIVITYVFIVLLYLTLKMLFGKTQMSFVFGPRTKYPILTAFECLLNGSLRHWPNRNFARTFWTLILIYGFVVRTAYQGNLIRFFRMQMSGHTFDTIDELINKSSMHVYVSRPLLSFTEHFPSMKRRIKPVTFSDYPQIFRTIRDSNDGSLLVSKALLDMVNLWTKKYTPIRYSNNLVSVNYAIFLTKRTCLLDEFNKHIGRMLMGGLVNQWVFDIENVEYVKFLALGESKEALLLTSSKSLQHRSLLNCMWIVFVGCSLATIIFILELLSLRSTLLRKVFNVF